MRFKGVLVLHKRLEHLAVSRNPLKSLKLGNHPKLPSLLCYDCELVELNLQGLHNLKWLYCDDNLIKELDLSAVPKLEVLTCENNELTEIDLKYCPNLKFIALSGNKLEYLDVSCCPKLTCFTCDDGLRVRRRESQKRVRNSDEGFKNIE